MQKNIKQCFINFLVTKNNNFRSENGNNFFNFSKKKFKGFFRYFMIFLTQLGLVNLKTRNPMHT